MRIELSREACKLDQRPTLRQVSELGSIALPLDRSGAASPRRGTCLAAQGGRGSSCWPMVALPARSQQPRPPAHRSPGDLARQSAELAAMDFTFLFDPARNLFSIGYNVTERRCDASFYDLLASEARLCSYVAIAQGQVSQDHWFSLGRLLVALRGDPVLVSWSGSMFEYLMPLLVMPNYETPCWVKPATGRSGSRSSTANCAACRGAFPNPATTGPTCI